MSILPVPFRGSGTRGRFSGGGLDGIAGCVSGMIGYMGCCGGVTGSACGGFSSSIPGRTGSGVRGERSFAGIRHRQVASRPSARCCDGFSWPVVFWMYFLEVR
jgi:hypothetical protein